MKLNSLILISLTACTLPSEASSTCKVNGTSYDVHKVVTRDACVIGGGSTGTYSAIRLKDKGKSVVVIEKVGRLGGHTQTYIDQATGAPIDVGVLVFHNLTIVRDYFARFNVSLVAANFSAPGVTNVYSDFRTGAVVSTYTPGDPSAGLAAYGAQLAKYPYVETGFDLPHPVPEDLLLSFKDFVKKYSLESAMPFIFNFAQGLGDILSLPTIYVFKNFGSDILQLIATNGFLTTAAHDNSLLYEAAQASLGEDIYLNSTIIAMDRGGKEHATIIAKTQAGLVQMQCQKVVFTVPPKIDNLEGFDLSGKEIKLFGQFLNAGYYTGLIRNSGLPDNVSVTNVGADTLYNLPLLPSIYGLWQTGIPGLMNVQYGSNSTLSDDFVKSHILASTKSLQVADKNISSQPELAVYYSHSPFECHVPAKAIAAGFYKKLYALQGQRRTFYTGAAFHTHDSSLLWQFTEALLPKIAT